ncbi:MAG: RluA family pseudouridine synthase [Leptolyngbyaceae cyanobacterium CSU_1_3]|nr:RluA family pseudouridine synthase [Leptolyngbyaceae cyanobacterium CSU_1_3]
MGVNQGWVYQEQVAWSGNGITILDYYTTRHRHSSREEWRDRIQSGLIFVNANLITDCNISLTSGQILTYHRPPWSEPDVPFDVDVLYEDQDLLILHKPSGLPVLPGGGFLENTVWGWLRQHYSTPPTALHRLGRGTSGILLLAKTDMARSKLSHDFRKGQICKLYRALATGNEMPDRFTVTQAIDKVSHPTLGYLYAASDLGKSAISHCRVMQRDRIPGASLLEVTIPTGRPHQIRIHLAAAGHPLWGDPLYAVGGGLLDQNALPGDCGYFLHAYQLRFIHPATAIERVIVAQPPALLTDRKSDRLD